MRWKNLNDKDNILIFTTHIKIIKEANEPGNKIREMNVIGENENQ